MTDAIDAPDAHDPSDSLDSAELAAWARSTPEHVRRLIEAGLLTPLPDGRHRVGDVHRIRIADAFLEAGIPLEALRRATEAGAISFGYYDLLHPDPQRPSDRSYGDLERELGGARASLLSGLYATFGLAEPAADTRLPPADEALLVELVAIAESIGEPDLALRVVRLLGDALRRATEAVMTVYDDAVSRIVEPAQGLPSQEVFDAYLVPWTRFARIAPRMGEWLTARHLSNAIDAYSVESTEHFLALGGYVPVRPEAPPAVAFVDLSGFTRLAEERGDERVASVAIDFARLAEEHAARCEGRLVKLLGDGVLLRFPGIEAAVDATLALLGALGPAGLPAGHAGVHAGPIIVRDGDIFGRTVNLASRIADLADVGQALVSASAASGLPAERYRLEPIGAAVLQGLAEPVELAVVTPAG